MAFKTETLSGTGQSAGLTQKAPKDTEVVISLVSPASAAVTFKILGSTDGVTYNPIAAIDTNTRQWVPGGTSIAPGTAVGNTWLIPDAANFVAFAVNVSSITNSVTFQYYSSSSVGQNYGTIAGASLASATIAGRANIQQLNTSPAASDVYAATMTIDVTKSYHSIAASNGTSAAVTMTPSAAGTAGDMLFIQTEADSSGTVTATFASTFHSSGTQATTASHFSSIAFQSDGTRWIEMYRTTAVA